jgi:hypothetical protein
MLHARRCMSVREMCIYTRLRALMAAVACASIAPYCRGMLHARRCMSA